MVSHHPPLRCPSNIILTDWSCSDISVVQFQSNSTMFIIAMNEYIWTSWNNSFLMSLLLCCASHCTNSSLRSRSPLLQHIHGFCWLHGLRFLGEKAGMLEMTNGRWVLFNSKCLSTWVHASRGQLEVGVPTRHFIWRDFFFRRITVKVTVVSGSLHLEKKKVWGQ